MDIIHLENDSATVSTSVIAENTCNEHASVISLVDKYIVDLEDFGGVGFENEPFKTAGGVQKRRIARLNSEQSTLLITYMRNSSIVRKFKKRLVMAFRDVNKSRFEVPQTLGDALQLAADQQKQIESLATKIKGDAPKVHFADKWMNSTETHSLRDAAKIIGVKPGYLINIMSADKLIFKQHDGSHWEPYQRRMEQGLFIVKPVNRGTSTYKQAKVTGKGLIFLEKRYGT